VHTRFPPEPNGYLHIGHAKAICLNFGIATEFGGLCNLRFDDTNPTKEDVEYVESIQADIRWLGFDWGERLFYASDYFEQLYQYAVQLIKAGKAYVDSLSAEEIRQYRGTLTVPGEDSPYRNRSVEENLDLFSRMRAGEFADGTHVLRAKIDMASGNINLRDRSCIAFSTCHITVQAMPGAYILCMTMPIVCQIPSKASRILCARWNLKTIARCTIGFWRRSGSIVRSRSNLPASISPTP
jgi:glutamyl/glutaminyl-tRNA synthetase